MFAALVIFPLVFELWAGDVSTTGLPERILRWVTTAQLPAALLLGVACWLPAGIGAFLAALPWAMLLGAMAVAGGQRARRGGWARDLDGLASDAALMFAVGGAGCLLAERAGWRLLGVESPLILLGTVHFHYAGVLLPLFAGLVQRDVFFLRLAARALVGVVLGVPAVAVGVLLTQLGAGHGIEAGTGMGFALVGMLVGVLQVRIALEAKRPRHSRVLMAVAGASLFFAMILSAGYATRSMFGAGLWLEQPAIRLWHGAANAIGFGLCGALAWRQFRAAGRRVGE